MFRVVCWGEGGMNTAAIRVTIRETDSKWGKLLKQLSRQAKAREPRDREHNVLHVWGDEYQLGSALLGVCVRMVLEEGHDTQGIKR